MKHNKWKQIGSVLLAVCLIATVLLANQSFGVFAEEDGTQMQESESLTEEGTESETENIQEPVTEAGEFSDTEATEEDTPEDDEVVVEDDNETEEDDSEVALEENEESLFEDGTDVAVQSEEGDEVIKFDLSKGSVVFTDDSYSGVDSDGNKINGVHNESNNYEILQSNFETTTSNTICVGTKSLAISKQFNIYLAGVNICVTNQNDCPVYINSGNNGKVYLILKNNTNNIVEINSNEINKHAAVEKELNSSGLLCIACEEGYKATLSDSTKGHVCHKNGVCGQLTAYANRANGGTNNGPYVSGAGIGSRGQVIGGTVDRETGEISVSSWLENILIAGGIVNAYGAAGDGSSSGGGAGIGTGSCGNSTDTGPGLKNFIITGGYINAIAGDDSASCIGGGYRSNEIQVSIYNGIVFANERVNTSDVVRGTGIGAGGGGTQSGSPSIATVKIYGGDITAFSQYGAAIGGAGAGNGTGNYSGKRAGSQPAYIYIYGGNIQATSSGNGAAIGTGGPYGDTTTGQAGDATVVIADGTITVNSVFGADIGGGGVTSNSRDSNGGNANINISGGNIIAEKGGIGGGLAVAGTGGNAQVLIQGGTVVTPSIGGGNSTSNKAGSAAVNVSEGTLTVNGSIGGGDATGTGNGGDASIFISGGTLDCVSIGGGNSVSGTPGSVTSTSQSAGVIVTGGTLKTGTIGGGKNENGDIGFATAEISGGNIQGQFILSNTDKNQKCFFTMIGGIIDNTALDTDNYLKAQSNGGAVYLSDPNGEVNISGGTIQNSSAVLGGAVYMTAGSFTLSGKATIQNCQAKGEESKGTSAQGGAVYLDNGTVTMEGGCILGSSAVQGGAVYLKSGTVTLSDGTIGIEESPNKADQGAGVYVAGGSLNVNGGSVMYNTAKSGAGAYLQKGSMKVSNGQILHNIASANGAGAYLEGGELEVSGGIITENAATENGGGVYLAAGNMRFSGGRIYNNSSRNGAGAYLNGGNLSVSGGGDFDSNTASGDGGGAYLAGGELTVESGTFNNNTASANGGGAYLAGGILTVNGGAFDYNTALNGGGAYAADGTVHMFGGNMTNNTASQDGGGFYVSSEKKPADVIIRSGKISDNRAGSSADTSVQGNGGAIAVVSNTNNADHVTIGLRHEHPDLDTSTRTFTSFNYNDETDNNASHTHASCPVITGNQATGNGGGIYMASSASILDIYCLQEESNISVADETGGSIMSVGGNVNIGDSGNDGNGNNTVNAVGNVMIKSKMLVKGGAVKIYGNTDNPRFADQILVDIQKNAGSFNDYRYTQITGDVNYKIEYFENFEGSGMFTAIQYNAEDDIPSMGTMYVHEGYKIIGWATSADATTPTYTTESGTLIGSKDDHTAWEGKGTTEALKLYAIWQKISYIVVYNANANDYSGNMENQSFVYGETRALTANSFKVKGKRFLNWNTMADGSGTTYGSSYEESKMTSTDGATVNLYAQWVVCTHKNGDHDGVLSYSLNDDQDTITESCDCENYSATLKISGADVYYDGASHPAILTGSLLAGTPEITYVYSETVDGTYGVMPEGTTEPVKEGYYKASITVEKQTAYVRYQIKSAASAATIDATAVKGQYFTDIKGSNSCTVAQDDAFTIQYQVQALNKGSNDASQKGFVTEPVLTLNQALPTGTTIIMQTGNKYWYNNQPVGTEIKLSSFREMGGTDSFSYNTSEISDVQMYRFVVDFSGVSNTAYAATDQDMKVGLKYAYTNPQTKQPEAAQDKEESVTVKLTSEADFNVSVSGKSDQVTVTAPSNVTDTRWEQKNLVWRIAADGSSQKLPSDARLTLTTTENGTVKTVLTTLNRNGEFIVPFDWAANRNFAFELESGQECTEGKTYKLTAAISVGSRIQKVSQPSAQEDSLKKATANVSLQIPVNKAPALKISSTQKVLTKSETLKVNVNYANMDLGTDNYSITAVIRKKDQNGVYNDSSDFGRKTITESGEQDISLASTNGPGSYCLWVTVSKKNAEGTNQTLLEVPYYFIIQ